MIEVPVKIKFYRALTAATVGYMYVIDIIFQFLD